ncbi:MAG: hypothetical protein IJU21_03360 [Bacteroidales bacterium]|nr:hypothetical protein [Bacteroidales bacterium]
MPEEAVKQEETVQKKSFWGGDYLAETLGWNEYLVTVLNLFFNLITEYTFQRLVVYGKRVDNRA